MTEPAKAEEPREPGPATVEDSVSSPEEQEKDAVEPAEAEAPAETLEIAEVQDPPSHVIDEPAAETTQAPPDVDPVVKSPNKGLVRGIVYTDEVGSALIDETIVQAGSIIDGVRVLRIHAGGVDFEKAGRRWTQKVSETPDRQWQ